MCRCRRARLRAPTCTASRTATIPCWRRTPKVESSRFASSCPPTTGYVLWLIFGGVSVPSSGSTDVCVAGSPDPRCNQRSYKHDPLDKSVFKTHQLISFGEHRPRTCMRITVSDLVRVGRVHSILGRPAVWWRKVRVILAHLCTDLRAILFSVSVAACVLRTDAALATRARTTSVQLRLAPVYQLQRVRPRTVLHVHSAHHVFAASSTSTSKHFIINANGLTD